MNLGDLCFNLNALGFLFLTFGSTPFVPSMFLIMLLFYTRTTNFGLGNNFTNSNSSLTIFEIMNNRLNTINGELMNSTGFRNFHNRVQNALDAQNDILRMRGDYFGTFLQRLLDHWTYFITNPVNFLTYSALIWIWYRIYFRNRFNILNTRIMVDNVIPNINTIINRLKNNNTQRFTRQNINILQSLINQYNNRIRVLMNYNNFPRWWVNGWWKRWWRR